MILNLYWQWLALAALKKRWALGSRISIMLCGWSPGLCSFQQRLFGRIWVLLNTRINGLTNHFHFYFAITGSYRQHKMAVGKNKRLSKGKKGGKKKA
jgi:hypothetical protein